MANTASVSEETEDYVAGKTNDQDDTEVVAKRGEAGCARYLGATVFVRPQMPGLTVITLPPFKSILGEQGDLEFASQWPYGFLEKMPKDWHIDLPFKLSEEVVGSAAVAVSTVLRFAAEAEPDVYPFPPYVDIDDVMNVQFPVMNSPITGKTLRELFTQASAAAGFFAAFPHPDGSQILTYFLVVGGTRIVFAAADGIGIALKYGLAYTLLNWMGAPIELIRLENTKLEVAQRQRRKALSGNSPTKKVQDLKDLHALETKRVAADKPKRVRKAKPPAPKSE